MASSLVLKVGSVTATINFSVSDALVAAALTRYANSLGIPMTGTAQENLAAVLAHVVDDIRRRSKSVQVADATATAQAAINATADADNNL